ncbi:hypothetical protein BT67DRAFT_314987 [Trichocladium antarcticum]|uniref:Uncharacterized protein n=1 Tax=Trichocladium antarcticum TaxID=1450529 RepID=A0AAN6UK01_9PEZI|nr:hypothetical protein BT67DRAFT_314987 [Trichocladium antarcticum]
MPKEARYPASWQGMEARRGGSGGSSRLRGPESFWKMRPTDHCSGRGRGPPAAKAGHPCHTKSPLLSRPGCRGRCASIDGACVGFAGHNTPGQLCHACYFPSSSTTRIPSPITTWWQRHLHPVHVIVHVHALKIQGRPSDSASASNFGFL